ncbi:MAG: TonB-dependent receptor [Vicinamibacterales bacterium]|nr:TonB-dependent receptor [Vicinamibacterales bacterium]
MKRLIRGVGVALAWLALAGAASAQVTSAALQGVVADSEGGVLPGVTVVITNVETGLVREAPADGAGFYRVTALPPGAYVLRASLDGFVPHERTGLVLTVGQTATVDVALHVASISEVVTVEARAPLVDTASSALGTTVTSTQLDHLPLAGRNFAGLANLAPGVTGVGGGGINAGGQLSRNNSVVIDGVSNDEQGVAGQRGSLSLEAVREFVVYTNQFAAEHGLASGALINVVTRSGTNRLSGRLFAFHRDDAFDAQNPFSKAQGSGEAPFSEQRAGGFLGGPILKNRWHYFGTVELLRDETTSVVTSPLVPVDRREFPRTGARDQIFARSEFQASQAHQIGVRYRFDQSTTEGGGIGGLNPYERGHDQANEYADAIVTLTSVLTSRTVNELRLLRGSLSTFWTVDRYSDPSGVSISRPSINLGKASNMPQGWSSVRYQAVNTLSHTFGRHDIKIGVDVQTDGQDTYFLGNKDGTFTFRTDAPFDPNDRSTYPFQFTQTIGDWYDRRSNEIYSAFAQTTWRAHDRLTLNLGLRYDTETIFAKAAAIDVAQDLDNVGPRIGVVFTPTGDGRTVVRGGFGIYYDQGFNNISGNISNSARSTAITVVNPGYPDPFDGGTIAVPRPNRTIAAPEIDTPSTRTFSAGVRRELRPGLALGVDVVRALGYNLFNAVDINAPLPGTGVRPDAAYQRVVQYQTTGESRSDSLLVSFERRAGRGPHFNLAYTWSTQRRNVEDFGFTAQDAFDPEAEWALASNDRRHQIVASVVWALPYGLQAAGLVQARRGLPWTVTTGIDNNNDQNLNDRPDLLVPGGDPRDRATYGSAFRGRSGSLGRNTNTGPGFVQVDARLSKFVRAGRYSVEGFVEAFNLLNRANLGLPVGTLTSSAFGRPTGLATGATPRQVELGVRFGF